ncbi:MAG: PilZ domain-containing protein [Hyphomicrobiaceae bacterium]|nr:PilZ domain-containing protein [Hyphomicrobiaceae bacterium]
MVSTTTTATALAGTSDQAAEGPSAAASERRLYRRTNVVLPGRFMRENKQEHPCKLRDISGSGAAIMSPVEPVTGERIVAYFDHIGGLEGVVARSFEGGFAIELRVTQHKREKIAAQLAWLTNRTHNHSAPQRRHERFTLGSRTATLRLDEDISIQVAVLDVSISGASVETEARPAIGSEVVLGKLRAKVIRHHVEGLGLEFIDIQNPDALRPYFR